MSNARVYLLALVATVVPAHAALLLGENFTDEVTAGVWDNFAVTRGNVDLLANAGEEPLCGFGDFCIDMDGTFAGARLESLATFDLVAGFRYTISFIYGNNPLNSPGGTNALTVSLGSFSTVLTASARLTAADRQPSLIPCSKLGLGLAPCGILLPLPPREFALFSFTAASDESARLILDQAGNDSGGIVLSRVSLAEDIAEPDPVAEQDTLAEPATVVLVGTSLLAVCFARRRQAVKAKNKRVVIYGPDV